MSDVRDADHARALRPGQPLGLRLDARVDEFRELLLRCPLAEVRPAGRDWLRLRYAEIVPLVLGPALSSVEHGRPLPASCLEDLRSVARRSAAEPDVDLSVALRGALPALRVFALVMQAAVAEKNGMLIVAMARASHVAHELGTCWVEAWAQHRAEDAARPAVPAAVPVVVTVPGPAVADPAAEPEPELDLVARAPDLDDVEERMLALTAYGMSNDEIARATSYSRQAVAWHLGRLMRSWNAPNRTALVSVAFVRGVIRSRRVRRPRRAPAPRRAIAATTDDRPAIPEG
ncbi:helix-turn-helix transcriptional regulator [Clavibacter michiganensis]|uniref:helix-turn-helix transcriptional regulator n=1 Tax=Clavibacter michiganensis TaxID=28447 RepID=UPI0011B05698|nr:LuxR C-terminal-related transcriptional regulator [Clavibacter michiganensis]